MDPEINSGEAVSIVMWMERPDVKHEAVLRHTRGTGHIVLASGATRSGKLSETDTSLPIAADAPVGVIVIEIPKGTIGRTSSKAAFGGRARLARRRVALAPRPSSRSSCASRARSNAWHLVEEALCRGAWAEGRGL